MTSCDLRLPPFGAPPRPLPRPRPRPEELPPLLLDLADAEPDSRSSAAVAMVLRLFAGRPPESFSSFSFFTLTDALLLAPIGGILSVGTVFCTALPLDDEEACEADSSEVNEDAEEKAGEGGRSGGAVGCRWATFGTCGGEEGGDERALLDCDEFVEDDDPEATGGLPRLRGKGGT